MGLLPAAASGGEWCAWGGTCLNQEERPAVNRPRCHKGGVEHISPCAWTDSERTVSSSSSSDAPVNSSSLSSLSAAALPARGVQGRNSLLLGSASRLLPLRRAAFAPCGLRARK